MTAISDDDLRRIEHDIRKGRYDKAGTDDTEPDVLALVDEVERLRRVITDAVKELDGEHRPDGLKALCMTCSLTDGSWPCVTAMVAAELRAALEPT